LREESKLGDLPIAKKYFKDRLDHEQKKKTQEEIENQPRQIKKKSKQTKRWK